ncbi:uncharacterized protein EV422DRAFT_383767 [Fimicolochytrium jonesii]|uniref:uncharacterized protein n=1 Tax=Fimicolochytrium jonesii TaxID=1396493 RepID=UPI0022FE3B49|nr:uncharacterized protein EV422DRAFT_383767 [Fimicolochytrium jonesii]KAI8822907.1 hypothetical protein EV422DRAFT_383767 [Fimicolochytrium jonesii]
MYAHYADKVQEIIAKEKEKKSLGKTGPPRSHRAVRLEPLRAPSGGSTNGVTILAINRSAYVDIKWQKLKTKIQDYFTSRAGAFQLIAFKGDPGSVIDPGSVFPITSNKQQLLDNLSQINVVHSSMRQDWNSFLASVCTHLDLDRIGKVVVFSLHPPFVPPAAQSLSNRGVGFETIYSDGPDIKTSETTQEPVHLSLYMLFDESKAPTYKLKSDVDILLKIRTSSTLSSRTYDVQIKESPYFKATVVTFREMKGNQSEQKVVRLSCKVKGISTSAALDLVPYFLNVSVAKHSSFGKPKPVTMHVLGFHLQLRHFLGDMIPFDNLTKINVLLMGETGVGKSTFINSSCFLLSDDYRSLALAGANTLAFDEFYWQPDINGPHGTTLPFTFLDTRGISPTNYAGQELELMLNGEMPAGIDWAQLSPETEGQCIRNIDISRHGGKCQVAQKPDVVLWLVSPSSLDDEVMMKKIRMLHRTVAKNGRQVVAGITRMDAFPDLRGRLHAIEKCKRATGCEVVLPLVNYTVAQHRRDFDVDRMLGHVWFALWEHGKDFQARMALDEDRAELQKDGGSPKDLFHPRRRQTTFDFSLHNQSFSDPNTKHSSTTWAQPMQQTPPQFLAHSLDDVPSSPRGHSLPSPHQPQGRTAVHHPLQRSRTEPALRHQTEETLGQVRRAQTGYPQPPPPTSAEFPAYFSREVTKPQPAPFVRDDPDTLLPRYFQRLVTVEENPEHSSNYVENVSSRLPTTQEPIIPHSASISPPQTTSGKYRLFHEVVDQRSPPPIPEPSRQASMRSVGYGYAINMEDIADDGFADDDTDGTPGPPPYTPFSSVLYREPEVGLRPEGDTTATESVTSGSTEDVNAAPHPLRTPSLTEAPRRTHAPTPPTTPLAIRLPVVASINDAPPSPVITDPAENFSIGEDDFYDRAIEIAAAAKDLAVQQHIDWKLVHDYGDKGIAYQDSFLKAHKEYADASGVSQGAVETSFFLARLRRHLKQPN